MSRVLIAGASGLTGTRLVEMLLEQGYGVNCLGRKANNITPVLPNVSYFNWNIETGEIDERAFEDVNTIINLAGAGIADKRWTNDRKNEIVSSRIKSTKLIYRFLKWGQHQVKTFICASAIGYYGDCADEILYEEHKAGNDFLATTCAKWEKAALAVGKLGIREVRCRIGIVLSAKAGALPKLYKSLPIGIAPYFAKTPLWYSWVHIDDVCGIIIYAMKNNKVNGAINTVAPAPVVIKDLMQGIVTASGPKAMLIPTPAIVVKLAMGEMSSMILSSIRCNSEKIAHLGYRFNFSTLNQALENIYG